MLLTIGLWAGVAAAATLLLRDARPDIARPAGAAAPAAPGPSDRAAPQAPAPFAQDLAAFAAIERRPLFTRDRRPPARAAAAAQAGPAPTLLGVFGPPAARVAVLADAAGETHRAPVGASVDGWTVETVTPRAARLRSGAATHEARLGDAPDGGPEATAAPRSGGGRPGRAPAGGGFAGFTLDGLGYDD